MSLPDSPADRPRLEFPVNEMTSVIRYFSPGKNFNAMK